MTTAPGSLTQRMMRDGDDGGVDYGGMLVEHIFHFDAVDILAAADQHVLGLVQKPSSSKRAMSPVYDQDSQPLNQSIRRPKGCRRYRSH
jgi:hypothetical protein